MTNEETKGQLELKVFNEFVEHSKLPINFVRKCNPPEPDMLCKLGSEYVAFEMAQISDESAKKQHQHHVKTQDPKTAFVWMGTPERDGVPVTEEDPVIKILNKKLKKTYKTAYPIELLLAAGFYFAGIDYIAPTIRKYLVGKSIQYRRIWIMDAGNNVACVHNAISA